MNKKPVYKLTEILAKPGDKVVPGQVIGKLEIIKEEKEK